MDRTVTLRASRLFAVVVVALVVGGTVGAVVSFDHRQPSDATAPDEEPTRDAGVAAFESADEFRRYLRAAERSEAADGGFAGARRATEMSSAPRRQDAQRTGAPAATSTAGQAAAATAVSGSKADASGGEAGYSGGSSEPAPRRASDTNVQVQGIDEPDVLKTTRGTLYYTTRGDARSHDGYGEEFERDGVHLLDASDPAAPEVASQLDVSGDLLLAGETLVVLAGDTLYGYDVANRSDPERVWSKRLSGRVVAARLYGGHVYLVTAERIDRDQPCPVRPMEGAEVACTAVHHPREPVPVDRTYAVTVLNPDDGAVDDTTGFVGAGGESVVYMSTGSVYVTYRKQTDRTDALLEFLVTNQSHRLDDEALEHLRELQRYDLGEQAKQYELSRTIQRWLAGMDEYERNQAREALQRDMQAWAEANKREFGTTGIAEFEVRNAQSDSPSLEPGATGVVPGRLLDQFSLDEHKGNLRVATTVGGAFGTERANDVYVLDDSLDVTGAVRGMGLTERIYSVRFVGEEAYVVTFRRVDPFHVLDLSDPQDPTLEGELKLPGYSSYLHPISADRVLGIGEEDGRVKLVVFDVSDPTNPTIEDQRVLDIGWSAVSRSHHAFLLDRRHGVFFLPAADGGHVFDYEDGLERVSVVRTPGPARRAAYVGDYLYVFGDSSVTVVDERTWTETAEVDL